MAAVTFTQYIRPDGRQQTITIERPDDVAAKARALVEIGLCLECEVLSTQQVSFSVTDPNEGDLAFEFSSSVHEGVSEAVDKLINDYHASLSSAGAV